jgi:uncharacterized RDD family membrane protein YckC
MTEGSPETAHKHAPQEPGPIPPLGPVICPACQRPLGSTLVCQSCGQVASLPNGVVISSPARRFGGYLLEGLLIICTLFIGWLVWALFAFANGQTPAKQLLGMRVVLIPAQSAGWGRMFLREFVAKTVVAVLSSVTFGIVNFWLLWDPSRQELWDKMVNTLVVNDPSHWVGSTDQTNTGAPKLDEP